MKPHKITATEHTLFSFATWTDLIFTIVGLLSGVLSGVCTPGIIVLYGNLAEVFLQYQITVSLTNGTHDEQIPVGYRRQSALETTPGHLAKQTLSFSIASATLGLAQIVFTTMFVGCLNFAALQQSCRARKVQFQALLYQDISWLVHQDPQDLAASTIQVTNSLQSGLGEKLGNFIATLSAATSCLLVAMYHGYKLAGSLVAVVPVIALNFYVNGRMTDDIKRQEDYHYKSSAQVVVKECLEHVRSVSANCREEYEVQRYIKQLAMVEHCDIMRGTVSSITGAILWVIIYSMYGFAFWQGVKLLSVDDNYSVSSLIIVSFCTHMAIFHFFQIPLFIDILKQAKAASVNVLTMVASDYARQGMIQSTNNMTDQVVAFDNVTFRHSPTLEILTNVSLILARRGTSTALVGPNGAGKTSVLSLIHRFYSCQEGRVKFNGMDIENVDLLWLRWQIGYAQQCPVLFGTTLMESITCLSSYKSVQHVKTAAEVAGIHSYILSLPDKYNSPLSWDLSVDQRQRLALARVLHRQPKLLLMDNSLSALSPDEEDTTFDRILQAYGNDLTIIIVTDNLKILKKMQRLLYLDKGHIDQFDNVHQMFQAYPRELAMIKKDPIVKCRSRQPACCSAALSLPRSFFDQSYQELLHSGLVQIGRYPALINHPVSQGDRDRISFMEMLRFLLQDRKRWLHLLLAILASVILGLNLPMYTVLFGETLSLIAVNNETQLQAQFKCFTTMFLIAGFVAGLCKIIQSSALAVVESKLTTTIRRNMFNDILWKKMEWFDTEARTICEISSILRKLPDAQQGCPRRLVFLVEALGSLSVSIALSLYYSWKLGLATLIFTPCTLLVLRYNKILVKRRADNFLFKQKKAKKTIVEAVRNAEAVAALTLEKTFMDTYNDNVDDMARAGDYGIRHQAFIQGCCVALPQLAYAVAMFYGGHMLKNNQIDAGTVFRVAEAIILGTLLVGHLVLPMETNVQQPEGTFVDMLGKQPQPISRFVNLRGRITFRDVSFLHSHYSAIPKISNFNLSIDSTERVAFVGRPSSGASIIIQLLLGFYQHTSGEILFDGQHLNNCELRVQIGLVEGEPKFFQHSIAYNIGYGVNYELPASEIIAVSKRVLLHDFIRSLPQGYNTVLDESIFLSTSQQIRLSLARALVKNPKILLFDNLTRCENNHDQRCLEEVISSASIGRTCIASTHDPGTVMRLFPRLVFVHRRDVTEIGTHDDLLAAKGQYYALWNELYPSSESPPSLSSSSSGMGNRRIAAMPVN